MDTPKAMEDNFYMVFVEGGNAPAYKHIYPDSAHTEAERLSKISGGKKAYVLKAVSAVVVKVENIKINPDDNLPF